MLGGRLKPEICSEGKKGKQREGQEEMKTGAAANWASLEENCSYWRSLGKAKGKQTTAHFKAARASTRQCIRQISQR